MTSHAQLLKLLSERDYIFSRGVAACMEGRENSEAYWRTQYERVNKELHEVCDALGVAYPELQQLPLLVFGTGNFVAVVWE